MVVVVCGGGGVLVILLLIAKLTVLISSMVTERIVVIAWVLVGVGSMRLCDCCCVFLELFVLASCLLELANSRAICDSSQLMFFAT